MVDGEDEDEDEWEDEDGSGDEDEDEGAVETAFEVGVELGAEAMMFLAVETAVADVLAWLGEFAVAVVAALEATGDTIVAGALEAALEAVLEGVVATLLTLLLPLPLPLPLLPLLGPNCALVQVAPVHF